jgi:phospholipase C
MPDPEPPLPPGIVRDHRESGIEHIFVLMLENRSFDHMLGFSGITGTIPGTSPHIRRAQIPTSARTIRARS